MLCEAFILAWNEEKLIDHTIRHYLSFCDQITVYDNHSTDKTVDISLQYAPKVNIIPFDTSGRIDERNYLNIKNECWKRSKADFVVVCDADEFIYLKAGTADGNIALSPLTRSDLEMFRSCKIIITQPAGLQAVRREPLDWKQPLMGQAKKMVRDKAFDKSILFNPAAFKEIHFSPGCHSCGPVLNEGFTLNFFNALWLVHYKYMDYNHVIRKHRAYQKRLSAFNRIRHYGAEYDEGENFIRKTYHEFGV